MTAAAAIPVAVPAVETLAAQIHGALTILLAPGQVAELRMPETHKGVGSGYFDDFAKMASRAAEWSGGCPAVYFTLNPVQPELLSAHGIGMKYYAKNHHSER